MQNDGGEREEERTQNNVGEREEKEEEEVVEDEFEEKLLSPKVSESSSVGVEEGMVERGTGKVLETAALENEFILDGFDFSTGMLGSGVQYLAGVGSVNYCVCQLMVHNHYIQTK